MNQNAKIFFEQNAFEDVAKIFFQQNVFETVVH